MRDGKDLIFAALTAMSIPMNGASAEPRLPIVSQCVACHGEDGIARDTEVPHLAGQNETYLYNQIIAFRSGVRPHKEMRFMARDMKPNEIAAIAAYYASLPR